MVEPVTSLVRVMGINYMVLLGELQTLVDWKVRGFPTTFLVDRQGGIEKIYIGFQDKSVFIRDLKQIAGEQ
jgi:hypothetical protein